MPDLSTLRLCSVLASSAFAGVFLVLWRGRRSERHLALWGAGAGLYACVLIALQGLETFSPLRAGLVIAALSATNCLMLGGVRAFDGHRPLTGWMIVLVVSQGVLAALFGSGASSSGRVVDAILLTISVIACGLPLALARPDDGTRATRRIVGVALLAYVPGFLASIALDLRLGPDINWIALLPMLSDQMLLGVMNLALLAIPGQRSHHALRRAALFDPLTGAWNRAALIRNETGLARAGNAAILIDIDHFKAINDAHGHAAGDAVLVTVAASLLRVAATRAGRVVRLGGDEFLLVFPATDLSDAKQVAETVRVDASRPADRLPERSVSLGIAMVAPGERGLDEPIARADRLLYRAKAEGRNRIAA
ncbi:diguanylate cyclase (GGDEF) domain-containing protein [Sphingomonas gellani]|uniref:diguanylate cyclase n=1 Tax=Sphingomonas gellani TaxID=1166340 RepID=A0A1H8HK27_9SPHN|nr:GGDEF domain-containing protein [Sphingomonas gellani]SEN56479.1 diguanylate cyclase (GGDEF) domain-containing protein [Sphingomonas gellani]